MIGARFVKIQHCQRNLFFLLHFSELRKERKFGFYEDTFNSTHAHEWMHARTRMRARAHTYILRRMIIEDVKCLRESISGTWNLREIQMLQFQYVWKDMTFNEEGITRLPEWSLNNLNPEWQMMSQSYKKMKFRAQLLFWLITLT